jgi:hypothetical protein
MSAKLRKRPSKRTEIKSALRSVGVSEIMDGLSPEELAEIAYELHSYISWWMGDPTEERILALRNSLPILDRMIVFDRRVHYSIRTPANR